MKLFENMNVKDNILNINNNNVSDLVNEFGSPLFVLDGDYVKNKCREIKSNFKHESISTEVIYASKAFSSKSFLKLIANEKLSLDVVSGGELFTAISAGFPMNKVYFHGNNKSTSELELALENNVHRIVVDNFSELKLLNSLCNSMDKTADILLRVNPGISAHTHEYIQTANDDSKFGVSFYSNELKDIIEFCLTDNKVTLKGLHCHIGSQIHESSSFEKAAVVMIENIKLLEFKHNIQLTELNLGGGFGVYYSKEDILNESFDFLKSLAETCYELIKVHNLSIQKLMIEPGRAIVANAGTTLYNIGFTKETISGKKFLFVDGGMTDNIRPALYQAKYEACIANRMNDNKDILYTVAGKCCESGDVLIKDISLPIAEYGDILAVASTGAYSYSMASNYNRIPKPAVVMIEDKIARIIIKRETYEDITHFDV